MLPLISISNIFFIQEVTLIPLDFSKTFKTTLMLATIFNILIKKTVEKDKVFLKKESSIVLKVGNSGKKGVYLCKLEGCQ